MIQHLVQVGVSAVLLWLLGEPGVWRYADAHPMPGSIAGLVGGGAIWLAAAVLFLVAAVLLAVVAAPRLSPRRRPS